jgi:replicative DNA helicase
LTPCLVNTIKRIEDMRNKNEEVTGVPSGFPSLDRVSYGWQNTDLIILAARPAVGKTAFALNLARNAVMHATKPTPVRSILFGNECRVNWFSVFFLPKAKSGLKKLPEVDLKSMK